MKIFATIATILLFQAIGLSANAQPNLPDREEKIESLRIAYLTKQLNLSVEEAQRFWPLYNQYQHEMKKLAKDHREKREDELEFEEKVLNLRKKYKSDFIRATSEEKFNQFMKADRDFKELLRKELEKRRANMQQGGLMNRRNGFPKSNDN